MDVLSPSSSSLDPSIETVASEDRSSECLGRRFGRSSIEVGSERKCGCLCACGLIGFRVTFDNLWGLTAVGVLMLECRRDRSLGGDDKGDTVGEDAGVGATVEIVGDVREDVGDFRALRLY